MAVRTSVSGKRKGTENFHFLRMREIWLYGGIMMGEENSILQNSEERLDMGGLRGEYVCGKIDKTQHQLQQAEVISPKNSSIRIQLIH